MPAKGAGMKQRGGAAAAPATGAGLVPFTSASHEHTELVMDKVIEFTEAQQQLGPFDVPAYGYFRHLLIHVETSTAGSAEFTAAQDYPFNMFANLQINDVNGAPIFGPMDGFAALYSSILGGYAGRPDPRVMPFYSATGVATSFILRIPLEISHHDGFGSLANQNAAAAYKIYATLNTAAKLQTSVGKTAPKIRLRMFLEAWSLPNETDISGRPQAEAPPMLDSAQYHSFFQKEVQNGNNTILMVRVGSLIRWLGFICRKANGERSDKVFPNPCTLEWDARNMREDTQLMLQEHLAASVPELKTRDTGVFAYLLDRSTKNTVGDDSPMLWYPTVQSTRLEIRGTTEEAGSVQIITNDVAPVAYQPQERYSEGSRTGFHPETGGGQAAIRS